MISKFFLKAEIAEQRYSICQSCDQLNSFNVCKECSCYMPFKTRIPWTDCPMNKWSTSDQFDENDPINPNTEPEKSKEEIIIVP